MGYNRAGPALRGVLVGNGHGPRIFWGPKKFLFFAHQDLVHKKKKFKSPYPLSTIRLFFFTTVERLKLSVSLSFYFSHSLYLSMSFYLAHQTHKVTLIVVGCQSAVASSSAPPRLSTVVEVGKPEFHKPLDFLEFNLLF